MVYPDERSGRQRDVENGIGSAKAIHTKRACEKMRSHFFAGFFFAQI